MPPQGQRREEAGAQAATQLQHNDFLRGTAEPKLVQSVVDIVRGTMRRVRPVSEFDGIPVVRRDYVGTDMSQMTREDWRSFRRGEEMVVLRVSERSPGEKRGSVRHVTLGSASRLGLDQDALGMLSRGEEVDLPQIASVISRLRSEASVRGNSVEIESISLTRPLDCLQFVNSVVRAGGGRDVGATSTTELGRAMESGNAIMERVDALFSQPTRQDSFFSQARVGDVVLFLRDLGEIIVGDAQGIEATSAGDRVLWMDRDGRPIPRERIERLMETDPDAVPGTAYVVRHSGLFAGNQIPQGEGPSQALVAQSHIAAGTITVESLNQYLYNQGVSVNYIDAVAIIPFEFFARPPAVASR
jgi:hypothetical protein